MQTLYDIRRDVPDELLRLIAVSMQAKHKIFAGGRSLCDTFGVERKNGVERWSVYFIAGRLVYDM